MAGEKDLPKTDDAVKKEAVKDASEIKNAGTPEAAYKKFREELNNMETSGFSGAQRLDYQKQLKGALGNDVDKVIVGYFNSEDSSNLKEKSTGYVKRESVNRVMAEQSRYGSDADAALPTLVIENFSKISNKNQDAGDNYITPSDIKTTASGFEDQSNKPAAIKAIQENKIADALVCQNMDRLFNTLDTSNQWTNEPDHVVSKNDVDRFLKKNMTPSPSEQKAVDAVKFIQQHWNDDIGHQLRGWDEGTHQYRDRLSKDSIAQASGYLDAEDFRKKNFNADGSKIDINSERDLIVDKEAQFNYGSYGRTFRINKENELVSYTDHSGTESIDYEVDKSGTVTNRNTRAIAGYNANLAADGTFTYNQRLNDATTAQKETPAAAPEQETPADFKIAKTDGDKTVQSSNTEKSPTTEEPLTNKLFLDQSTQHSGQGYWQVAEKMIQNGKSDVKVSPTENTILMRALQAMHKKHPGKLGGHSFVTSQSDLDELKGEIKNYSNGKPAFKNAAPALIDRLTQMAAV